jgi:type I restriction enzyme R subunit
LIANQLEFLNILIENLTARGAIDAGLLYEWPFTEINTLGVAGVFPDADVARIVDILTTIRDNAAAA